MKTLNTVDLFCGAGGASTGLEMALDRLGMAHHGLAINHWRVAVDTMRANHPDIDTKQMSIEEAIPAELVPGGEVDFLWASPSCTHHSRAKGGKPRSNQMRAQPNLVLDWLDQLFVRRFCIENVPEFVEWGPLTKDGRPIKNLKGACFNAWIDSIKARGYKVEWQTLNCADYGDATTRKRFFLQAVRHGCGKIVWPMPTYSENPQPDLWGNTPKRWRGVRECLDFTDLGKSIFDRKKPLARNTLRRIEAGLRKYCGISFLMDMLGTDGGDDSRLHDLSEPMPVQHSGGNRCALVHPYIVQLRGGQTAQSIEEPLSTVATSGAHHMLCNPIVLDHFKNGEAQGVDDPIGAQTTHDRWSMITPLVLGQQSCAQALPTSKPCPTIATSGAVRVITPMVLGRDACAQCRSAAMPMPTLTTGGAMRGIFPVLEDGRLLDIRIRMLKPSELAAAHSFPADYQLTGNRSEQVKQIGNSVPCLTACAICEAALSA